ncbi:MAG TPA: hypothetical protein GXZ97_10730 [Hydrogenispora sp.]|nr:hypothetical protein [Hydrogenispora sp.]
MNYIVITTNCILPEPPVVLSKSTDGGLVLKKQNHEAKLNGSKPGEVRILPEIGSLVGNVIFIIDDEFTIDSSLGGNTTRGVFRFKEPEQTSMVNVTRTTLGKDNVLAFYFNDFATARRFIDKKIFGEFYLLNAVDDQLIFYPQLKEVYLFSTSTIEVGFLGFLDCANTLWAPSAKITELPTEPLGKKTYEIEDTDIVVELPIHKRYKLDFSPASASHIIRMRRGKTGVKNKGGELYWSPQDEILKVYICEEQA